MDRISVHTFNSLEDATFSRNTYSQFKYGCLDSTIAFAKELAYKLAHYVMFLPEDAEIMISGAPYNQIPVASTALAEYTCAFLSATPLVNSGLTLGQKYKFSTFKISRQHSYHDDYGVMSKEQRDQSISGETFHVEPALLEGKHVILIDDILITGAHERRVRAMIDKLEINTASLLYAYYAELKNSECCPTIESDLNHAFISKEGHGLEEVCENIVLNTRVTKMLLSLQPNIFKYLILYGFTKVAKLQLWKYALGNAYATHEKYSHNFQILNNIIKQL